MEAKQSGVPVPSPFAQIASCTSVLEQVKTGKEASLIGKGSGEDKKVEYAADMICNPYVAHQYHAHVHAIYKYVSHCSHSMISCTVAM